VSRKNCYLKLYECVVFVVAVAVADAAVVDVDAAAVGAGTILCISNKENTHSLTLTYSMLCLPEMNSKRGIKKEKRGFLSLLCSW